MKRVVFGISIILNVLLLVGLILIHLHDTSNCSKKGENTSSEEKDRVIECIRKENKTEEMNAVDDYYSRAVLVYSEDGTLISLKRGNVIKYKNEEDYQNPLKESKENVEELGDLQLFFYETVETKEKRENGSVKDIWYKDIVQSLKDSGYQCN